MPRNYKTLPLAIALTIACTSAFVVPAARADCSNRYRVLVRTADASGAGTDSNIYMTLYGHSGASFTERLNPLMDLTDAFERDTVSRGVLCVQEHLGRVSSVRLKSDGKYAASDWMVSAVGIEHPDGVGSLFTFNTWIDEDSARTVACSFCEQPKPQPWNVYAVTLKTSDQTGAGTDANIYLTLFSDQGESPRYRLNGSILDANAFERDQKDIVFLWGKDLGRIERVRLENDGSYSASDWHVDQVEVLDKDRNTSVFVYRRWVNTEGSDDPKQDQAAEHLSTFSATLETSFSDTFTRFNVINNLGGGDAMTKTLFFEHTVSEKIERSTKTGSGLSFEGSVSWEGGGVSAEASAGWNTFVSERQATAASISATTTETIGYSISPGKFSTFSCHWSILWDGFRLHDDDTEVLVRTLKSAPSCAITNRTYPTPYTTMSRAEHDAAQDQFGEEAWLQIEEELIAKGVKFQ